MRKTIMTMLVILAVTAAQAQVRMQISGVCKARTDTVIIYNLSTQKEMAQVKTADGKFAYHFEGADKGFYGVGEAKYFMPFICDGVDISVDLVEHTMKGSALNEQLFRCDNKLDSIDDVLRSRIFSLATSGMEKDKMVAKSNELMADRKNKRLAVLEQYRSTLIPAVYLPKEAQGGMSYDEVMKWLDPTTPYYDHPNMLAVKRYAANLEKKKAGRMFVDLTMNDLDGNPRSLSEWCGKGNYVLVDFWASWCGPCRREMPNVVASYVKYHKKGYEIIGVSFDNKENAWKAAVKSLGMDWPQISDLKGWGCAASDAYGVDAIPSNVLLGPDGRIVASDLRGDGLERKLQEIFGF